MIVLDASVGVEWLLRLPQASRIDDRLAAQQGRLHVPHLFAVEVAQVVRRFVARGDVSVERGAEALVDLAAMTVVRYAHEPFLPLIWQLRANLTAYDAAYVALALALEAPLLTLDRHLAAAPHGADVDLIADSLQ